MSAFLCSAEHIGKLVAWYADNPPEAMTARGGKVDRRAMAHALVMCNLHSLGYRYQDCPGRPDERYQKPFDHMSEENADRVLSDWVDGYNNALALVAATVTVAEQEHATTAADAEHLAACLNYQCCEHPEYSRDGEETIQRIRDRAKDLAGADKATVGWGI